MGRETNRARSLLYAARRRLAARPAPPPAARDLTVLPSDVFLVSYPRSGNTWMRFLLGNALRPKRQTSFATLAHVVPDIYDETDAALLERQKPRILKSHEPYADRYRRVLYLVRHPADVAVSYYHYLIKMRVIGAGHGLPHFVDELIGGRLDGFGTWGDHICWVGGLDESDFLLLRYEDMLDAPGRALSAALGFIGVDVSGETIAAAVERSAAGELRRLELETGTALPTLRGSRLEDPFIREARAGAGADELAPELFAQIVEAWPEAIERAGYRGGSK